MKVHFMGIAGSGMAPIALIAKSMGYEVSGCDISDSTYYSNALNRRMALIVGSMRFHNLRNGRYLHMKRTNKVISVFIALALLLTLVPIP